MIKNNIKIIKSLSNLDVFSKLILLAMLFLGIYLISTPFLNGYFEPKKKETILEVSKNFSFKIEDYAFQHYSRDRLNNDMFLNIFLKDSLNLDDYKKIKIKITPEQEFDYTLAAENLIQIRFKNEAPADGKENTIEFFLNNNLLGNIKYKNLEIQNSDAEEKSVSTE